MVIKREKVRWIQYFLQLLIVIEPKLFTQYKGTTLLYASCNILLFMYFLYKRWNDVIKIPRLLIFWVVFQIYQLVLLIVGQNSGDIVQWGYLALMVANMIFIIDTASKEKQIGIFLSALSYVCIIFLAINMLSLLIFKEGIIPSTNIYDNGDGDYYFLGIKVLYFTYIPTALAASGTYAIIYKKKKLFIVAFLVSLMNILYANISTGIVCFIIFIMMLVLIKVWNINFSIVHLLVLTIILNIAVVVFNIQDLFGWFIAGILHKSSTLTGRTDIWMQAQNVLKENGIVKLIFGNGIVNGGSFIPFGNGLWPAHNQWIQSLFETGIIGTLYFIYFLGKMDSIKKKYLKERKYLLCVCIMPLIETITMACFQHAHVYWPFLILYYVNYCFDRRNVSYE